MTLMQECAKSANVEGWRRGLRDWTSVCIEDWQRWSGWERMGRSVAKLG